ncbi:NADH:flavin oxidoreductase/NADH oxidase [Gymnopus androsaceus JB14]|uniref:NADH:flavin oxidoreductase/NADH oxidase n=1 Tax=Gymnopus androsaceus JB14 TaxID=1447944 RepID=A0A6A4I8F8_9AGAR|nr:NADH:flavin oxidoreductase/NADH oxidase [Gymnopus androsaceus JB14]
MTRTVMSKPSTSNSSCCSKLFQPIRVGRLCLQHRIVYPPQTRYKATRNGHVPLLPLVKEYYSQRASMPGTLIITEAALVSDKAGGKTHLPGIWNESQIKAWKVVADEIHAKGCMVFMQIWGLGRAAEYEDPGLEDDSAPFEYVSASDVQLPGLKPPRPLTISEIQEYITDFGKAAANAVHGAGFDGVELHAANGYLLDQFIQDVTNKRTDEFGGSVEARCRFVLEVMREVCKAVGQDRASLRLSPWSLFQNMRMTDPVPTFSYLVTKLKEEFPNLAYLHLVEPQINGSRTQHLDNIVSTDSNDFLRDIWRPRPFISAGGYTRATAMQIADEKGDLIAFGRYFISNPDLPFRIKHDLPLVPYDRDTFYIRGDTSGRGYIDYPFYTSNDSDALEGLLNSEEALKRLVNDV